MVNAFSDYTSDGSGNVATDGAGNGSPFEKPTLWSLERCKRAYQDYLNSKVQEVLEQKDARRYRHASQWTDEQIKVFKKRKQPIVVYNRVGRKIDAVVGLIEKLKQSPKAYPRTPNEEESADLATQVIREVLDENNWKAISYQCGQDGAIDGIGGVDLELVKGDLGDPTIGINRIQIDGFFYDPRSIELDFSDARYMGQGKWLDLDQAREMFPDRADQIEDAMDTAGELSTNSDREQKWFITDGYMKRIRIVDIWYILNGEWYWTIFSGTTKLDEGPSPFHDDKKKSFCKYIMFSGQVDQDGDRYGFVRNLKSAQDEVNQRRSKALHLLNTRRIIAEQGAFDDLEVARREAARPDGIVIKNKGFEAEFDDAKTNQEIQAHLQFLVDAKSEIENFGPNPALIGQGALGDKSGRAIQLLQQAGIAELGPFLLAFRGWKIRLYRAIWNAAKEYWKAQRFIRVTDDQSVLQFIPINQVGVNPQSGMPAMVNHLASLDVDIIMDEGPDSINSMADTYDALIALVQNGAQVPPDVLLELAPGIDPETRKRLIERLQAPDPLAQTRQQLEIQNAQATIAKTAAQGKLANAQAVAAIAQVQQGPDVQFEQPENPAVVAADIENKQADTLHKKAQALKTLQEAHTVPQKQALEEQKVSQDTPQHGPEDAKLAFAMKQHEDKMALEREKLHMAKTKAAEDQVKSSPNELASVGFNTLLGQHVGPIAETLSKVVEKIDEMAKDHSAPLQVSRDQSGRIASAKKGSRIYKVNRDKAGRLESMT